MRRQSRLEMNGLPRAEMTLVARWKNPLLVEATFSVEPLAQVGVLVSSSPHQFR